MDYIGYDTLACTIRLVVAVFLLRRFEKQSGALFLQARSFGVS